MLDRWERRLAAGFWQRLSAKGQNSLAMDPGCAKDRLKTGAPGAPERHYSGYPPHPHLLVGASAIRSVGTTTPLVSK